MKIILFVTLLFSTSHSAFALNSEVEDSKLNIRRLTDRVYEETRYTQVPVEKLRSVEKKLQDAISILRGEEAPPVDIYDRNECLRTVLDLNYSPSTATETCDSISSKAEFDCVKLVFNINYGPQSATRNCKGIVKSELSCFQDILSRNYGPDRAREVCVQKK